MTIRQKIYFLLATILFLFVNVSTIYDGHNWGDDFAQYILHAKNIAAHHPYAQGIMLDLPSVVSPGFPLLIAPLIKLFGVNFLILKSLNIVFWILFVFSFYGIALRYVEKTTAFLCALLLLSSPLFFTFKQNILSDIPFLCFITSALYAWIKYLELPKDSQALLRNFLCAAALFLTGFSFLIRPASIALFAALVLYFALIRREKTILLAVILSFLLALGIQASFGSSSMSHLKEFPHSSNITFSFLYGRAFSVFDSIAESLLFLGPGTGAKIISVIGHFFGFIAPFLLLWMITAVMIKTYKKTSSFLDYYFLLYGLGTILWPVPGGDGRYVLPLIGLVVLFSINSLCNFFKYLAPFIIKNRRINGSFFAQILIAGLIAGNLITISSYFKFNDNYIGMQETQEMIGWMKSHTEVVDRFMFWRPRALALLTQRVGTAPWVLPQDQVKWLERIKHYHIRYVIFFKSQSDLPLIIQLEKDNTFAYPVWENPLYKIFKITENSAI